MEETFTQYHQDTFLLSKLREEDPSAFKLISCFRHWVTRVVFIYYF